MGKDLANELKAKFGNRPVYLTDVGGLGGSSAAEPAHVLMDSGMFVKEGNPFAGVYWNVYPEGYSSPAAWTVLHDVIQTGPKACMQLGEVFLQQCGASLRAET